MLASRQWWIPHLSEQNITRDKHKTREEDKFWSFGIADQHWYRPREQALRKINSHANCKQMWRNQRNPRNHKQWRDRQNTWTSDTMRSLIGQLQWATTLPQPDLANKLNKFSFSLNTRPNIEIVRKLNLIVENYKPRKRQRLCWDLWQGL